MPERDPRLAEVVGGHLDVDLVTDADADEVFAHFAGDVGEDFMAVGEGDAEHGAGQHLGHNSGNLYGLFFGQAIYNTQTVMGANNAVFAGRNQAGFGGFIQQQKGRASRGCKYRCVWLS